MHFVCLCCCGPMLAHAIFACRLAHGRTLERDAVLQLLQHCIEHPFPEQHERGISNRRTATLHQLKGLEPGRHITGDDILSLLEQCIKHFDFM